MLTGPALAGRESGTGEVVPISLSGGLSIVNGALTVAGGGGGGEGGGVTSVGLSAPTGFSVAGTPVTGSGTLALSFASGYSLPTTAKQGQWEQAYSDLGQARTPTAHKATHATGGTDALSPADIGAATATQGAKADTAIQPGNAALSDAREWSADTISQAEAEAGAATTRRAFTAARVFQAVAAWWAGSTAKTKLDGIASEATANSTDAQLRDRTTHTGTQAATTITGLSTVATSGAYNDLSGKPDLSLKADLVNGLVPSSQLPGTDAIPEGSVNLYHTTLRAAAAAPVQSVAGRTGTITLAVGDVANAVATTDNRLSDARTPTAHNQAWSTITSTPTTLSGYGITGAVGTVTTGITGAAEITNIISISQSNYDAIPTKNAQTLYVISG